MLTYTYKTGKITPFALRKADLQCDKNGKSIPVGVFCKQCPHYEGMKANFVICSHPEAKDDDDITVRQYRSEICQLLPVKTREHANALPGGRYAPS